MCIPYGLLLLEGILGAEDSAPSGRGLSTIKSWMSRNLLNLVPAPSKGR